MSRSTPARAARITHGIGPRLEEENVRLSIQPDFPGHPVGETLLLLPDVYRGHDSHNRAIENLRFEDASPADGAGPNKMQDFLDSKPLSRIQSNGGSRLAGLDGKTRTRQIDPLLSRVSLTGSEMPGWWFRIGLAIAASGSKVGIAEELRQRKSALVYQWDSC